MKAFVALVSAALLMSLFAFGAIFVTGMSSTQHLSGQSLLVGNALRSSDLTGVGTISGELSIDKAGFWTLSVNHSSHAISAPGGSALSAKDLIVVGSQQFVPGELVEVQGGYSATGVLFFWTIAPVS